MKRLTVAVDFDGVLHSYESGWKGATKIPDPPVAGAIEWLVELVQTYNVVIVSTRARRWWGRRAIRAWLRSHCEDWQWIGDLYNPFGGYGLEDVKITATKVPALVYLDDRDLRFEGTFPAKEALEAACTPWNRKPREEAKR